jgi:hypothetical protein
MSSWADNDGALDSARESLADRFPGTQIEILECFDIAWQGWDGDSKGALMAVDGEPRIIAIDQTLGEDIFEGEIFAQQSEYRRLLDDTARVLSSLWNRRASRGDRREQPSEADRLLTHIYRRLAYVEQMGERGRRHVLDALRRATDEAVQFEEGRE